MEPVRRWVRINPSGVGRIVRGADILSRIIKASVGKIIYLIIRHPLFRLNTDPPSQIVNAIGVTVLIMCSIVLLSSKNLTFLLTFIVTFHKNRNCTLLRSRLYCKISLVSHRLVSPQPSIPMYCCANTQRTFPSSPFDQGFP